MTPAGAEPCSHGPDDQSRSPTRTSSKLESSNDPAVAVTVFCSHARTGGAFHSGAERTAYRAERSWSR